LYTSSHKKRLLINSTQQEAAFINIHKFFKAYVFGGYVAEKKE
jgi:hypothetical protein